jgi:anti-anti-sigma factor
MARPDRERLRNRLNVQLEQDDDAIVVRVRGEIDLASAHALVEELRRAIGGAASTVFLDLGNVGFIDSTGLRALLVAAKLSSMNGSELRILRGSSPVERAIETSGVEDLLPLAD